jgi:membrane-anchored mycosin MYCP
MQTYDQDGTGYRLYNRSDLITSTSHAPLILAKLRALGVQVRSVDQVAELALTKLTLDNVEAAAHAVSAAVQEQRADPPAGRPRPEKPLDQVLWGLRVLFAARWAGWTPSLGKNRLVGSVTGVGEISHGGTDDPVPVPPERRPGPRTAGPGGGVRVGVLDTALSPLPWLSDGWQAGWGSRIPAGTLRPYVAGHATFATGLILSQAPNATVELSRVLDENGSGDSWTVAREIVRVGNSGVDVLNLSLVCYTDDGEPPMALAAAVDRVDPGVVVVAAAGNHGADRSRTERILPSWPAALDDVLAVGSTTSPDAGRPRLSAFTPNAPWVDVLAAGEDVVSTYPDRAEGKEGPQDFGGWAQWSGTSFSAALVSGALAAAVQPGRVSARAALDGLWEAVGSGGHGLIGETMAPYLPMTLL